MPIEIIAEVAQGYEGDPKLSELLALAAVRSNADAVKYQIIFADEMAVPAYQHYALFKSLEMETDVWKSVVQIIHSHDKRVYFDVYGDMSLSLAKELKADSVKISTTDFSNKPLIRKAAEAFDSLYLSIGGIPIEEVEETVKEIKDLVDLTLLYGFQAEPTPIEQNNLARLPELVKRFPECRIGFMDHSEGSLDEALLLPVLAVGLGVDVIEKHITLDRVLEIEDFVSALTPERFARFVESVRTAEKALGKANFQLTPTEMTYRNKAGKVVVADRNLTAGSVIGETDIVMKRVVHDDSLTYFRAKEEIMAKKLKKDVERNNAITSELL